MVNTYFEVALERSHNIHTQMSLGVLGSKSDNHSNPIISDPNTYSLLFINSDWLQTLSLMVHDKQQ